MFMENQNGKGDDGTSLNTGIMDKVVALLAHRSTIGVHCREDEGD